jgi:ribose 5-phosphate isomerase A
LGLKVYTPKFSQGVPIEVVPFAYAKVLQNLHEILGSPKAILRMAKMKAGPVVSDNANFIIDAPFEKEVMKDPYTVNFLTSLILQMVLTLWWIVQDHG